MKKTLSILAIGFGIAILAQLTGVSFAAPYPPALGGTGTSAIPASGTIPIGNGAGTYTPALITPGTDIIITNASGSLTIAVRASDFLPSSTVYVASVNGQSGTVTITSSTLGALTLQTVLNSLSATGLATYSTSTSSGTISVSSSSLNLKSASQFNFSDFLPSSTVYVATVNGQSGAVTIGVPATTTINGVQATVFKIIGDGTTVTSTVNGTTTTFSIITTGNWAGTWQGVSSNTFYLASNPNGYTSSTVWNVLGSGNITSTATGSTTVVSFTGILPAGNGGTGTTTALGSAAFRPLTDFLCSSTVLNSPSTTIPVPQGNLTAQYDNGGYLGSIANLTNNSTTGQLKYTGQTTDNPGSSITSRGGTNWSTATDTEVIVITDNGVVHNNTNLVYVNETVSSSTQGTVTIAAAATSSSPLNIRVSGALNRGGIKCDGLTTGTGDANGACYAFDLAENGSS
jgi:hypothetical protein